MKCKNNPAKSYTGKEPSPKGLGYCASGEVDGAVMKGRDGQFWRKQGGKWVKTVKFPVGEFYFTTRNMSYRYLVIDSVSDYYVYANKDDHIGTEEGRNMFIENDYGNEHDYVKMWYDKLVKKFPKKSMRMYMGADSQQFGDVIVFEEKKEGDGKRTIYIVHDAVTKLVIPEPIEEFYTFADDFEFAVWGTKNWWYFCDDVRVVYFPKTMVTYEEIDKDSYILGFASSFYDWLQKAEKRYKRRNPNPFKVIKL